MHACTYTFKGKMKENWGENERQTFKELMAKIPLQSLTENLNEYIKQW